MDTDSLVIDHQAKGKQPDGKYEKYFENVFCISELDSSNELLDTKNKNLQVHCKTV